MSNKNKNTEKPCIIDSVMCCPCCKSEDIKDISLYADNNQGVVGGTYEVWKTLDIRRCNKCGVVFQPLDDNT